MRSLALGAAVRLLVLLFSPVLIISPVAPAGAARPAFSSDRISVDVRGSGRDVVLIPGLNSSPHVWDTTVAALPKYRYHVVHVGGFAGKPAGVNASGPILDPVAAEIARYIEQAGLKKPAVVGHSLGGFWGMMLAARYPDRISRLMVVDMFPFISQIYAGPSATPESVRPFAEQMRKSTLEAAGEARRKMAEQTIATMVRTESFRPEAVKASLESDPRVSAQAMYEIMTTDLRPQLTRIKVPVTVLWVRSPSAPVSEAQMAEGYRAAYANIAHARLKQVPGAWHFIMWDEPQAFQRERREFLAP